MVQGGLRILDKVQALGGASLTARPRLGAPDWLRMLARAVRLHMAERARIVFGILRKTNWQRRQLAEEFMTFFSSSSGQTR